MDNLAIMQPMQPVELPQPQPQQEDSRSRSRISSRCCSRMRRRTCRKCSRRSRTAAERYQPQDGESVTIFNWTITSVLRSWLAPRIEARQVGVTLPQRSQGRGGACRR